MDRVLMLVWRVVGERTRKMVKYMLVVETGTEVDVRMGPVKKVNKGIQFITSLVTWQKQSGVKNVKKIKDRVQTV